MRTRLIKRCLLAATLTLFSQAYADDGQDFLNRATPQLKAGTASAKDVSAWINQYVQVANGVMDDHFVTAPLDVHYKTCGAQRWMFAVNPLTSQDSEHRYLIFREVKTAHQQIGYQYLGENTFAGNRLGCAVRG